MSKLANGSSPNSIIGSLEDGSNAMTITREYFSHLRLECLQNLSAIISSTESKKEKSLYMRWLLSRNNRKCVVDVCRVLLEADPPTAAILKEEIESEVIIHVAVDLMGELLKAGLKFSQFFQCHLVVRTYTDNTESPIDAVWNFMIFKSQLCSTPDYLYDRRPDPSERFAYLVIGAMVQACNLQPDSLEGLAYIIQKYPMHPMDVYTYGKVFRSLVLAGIGPSNAFLCEMDGTAPASIPEYYEIYRTWYENFRRQVPSLKHCARLAVRQAVTVNLEYAVTRLGLPSRVGDLLLLRDDHTLALINVDDRD